MNEIYAHGVNKKEQTRNTKETRLSYRIKRARAQRIEAPQHAEALLRDTPQLRFLCDASTDMQLSGSSSTDAISNALGTIQSRIKNEIFRGRDAKSTSAISNSADYRLSLTRDEANQQAAEDLASSLWTMAHEMTLEDYGAVESKIFTSVFSLIHSQDNEQRMAGLARIHALIDVPSADEEKKAIKFANTLSSALRNSRGDYEFLSSVSKSLGYMATRTANVDFVESEITRALEWLRTERSDRRLAATLSLKEFALNASTAFYSKTSQSQGGSNEFLENIFAAIRDTQPIVRACAVDALSYCLRILVDRQHLSLTGQLCQVYFSLMEGLQEEPTKKGWNSGHKTESSQHGSLLVIATMIAQTRDFMLPRYDEVCQKVMLLAEHPKALMRLEVIRLMPRLARRCPKIFARRYLEQSLDFLLRCASSPVPPRVGLDIRPSAFSAIGLMALAMVDPATNQVIGASLPVMKIEPRPIDTTGRNVILTKEGIVNKRLESIFSFIKSGLSTAPTASTSEEMNVSIFHCAADLIEALGEMAIPYLTVIDDMFRAGLSNDLIQCLHVISECVPAQQDDIEDRLFQEISLCLAGLESAREVCDPLLGHQSLSIVYSKPLNPNHGNCRTSNMENDPRNDVTKRGVVHSKSNLTKLVVRINMSDDFKTVSDLILSLQTLGSFGDSLGRVTILGAVVPLLPFVKNVAAQYMSHPSSKVRQAAALTCCTLLIPDGVAYKDMIGSHSGLIVESVLGALLRLAVSDPSPDVRREVVGALHERFDPFLCQAHHLQSLYLLLQDEMLSTRAAGMGLLGRLALVNPAGILSLMRKALINLIVELQCGVDTGRGREEATKLLAVFLRSKAFWPLIQPVLPSLIKALPLDGATPRLASAALEALGELAKAAGASLRPWTKEVIPNILVTLQDQSSSSKQMTSLKTLAHIAGSTGYVIDPYLDYPTLLPQAIDILPGTKRAPWALRREVIRTLGVIGALDPDRYHLVAPKTRKGGAIGGAYFVVQDEVEPLKKLVQARSGEPAGTLLSTSAEIEPLPAMGRLVSSSSIESQGAIQEEDLPAHLFMYEQYAMVAQPISSLPPAQRMTPADEDFYPTVAIQALMRIFKNPSLSVHHGTVMQAIMFIFKSLGFRCVQFLSKIVPHILLTIRTCGPSNLRESLLKQVTTLSGIVREHLRPYVADIFDIVEQFWSSRHLATIFGLIQHLANGVPDEFKRFAPRLIKRVLTSLDEVQVVDWTEIQPRLGIQDHAVKEAVRLRLVLYNIQNLRDVLDDYLHVLVPGLLRLAESIVPTQDGTSGGSPLDAELSNLAVLGMQTIASLIERDNAGNKHSVSDKSVLRLSLPARTVQPFIRLLMQKCKNNSTVGTAIIEALCICARQLGSTIWLKSYHGVVKDAITNWQTSSQEANKGTGHAFQYADRHGGLRLYLGAVRDMVEYSVQASPIRTSYMETRSTHHSLETSDRFVLSMPGESQHTATMFDAPGQVDTPVSPTFQHTSGQNQKPKVNQGLLQRSWDVSQCASREDWDEWARRLAIQLLREAPSPSLRAAASLAPAYQPLSRELFGAAFVCCWRELSAPYRANLVHALVSAFRADVSPEILQSLLNLAEFMEHDESGGLPIEISVLADLALRCRAHAKALHYKEREYKMGGSNACVEALLDINRKLDLQDAALGILKSAIMHSESNHYGQRDMAREQFSIPFGGRSHQLDDVYYGVIMTTRNDNADPGELDLTGNKEIWLMKLGSWTEALRVYEDKLRKNPQDQGAILGCMQCLSASAQWRRVLELAENSLFGRDDILRQPRTRRDGRLGLSETPQNDQPDQETSLLMCSEAAWRLGRWNDLEKYSAELIHAKSSKRTQKAVSTVCNNFREGPLPEIDFDSAFFSALLHIHKERWNDAAEAIDIARKSMDSRFTALMAESYNRAYHSMVTAQTLSEMEEVINFRQLERESSSPDSQTIVENARQNLLRVWRKRLVGCRIDAEVYSSILAVRSLVLGPTDEVDATLTLSELSRQSQRVKLAERVLLDPLLSLGSDLNGSVFGFGLAKILGLRAEYEKATKQLPLKQIIDGLIASKTDILLPSYSSVHSQWSKKLVNQSGSLERLQIQHKLYFAFVKHLWLTDRREEAMHRLTQLCDVVDLVTHFEPQADSSLQAACWLELGEWKIEDTSLRGSLIPESLQIEVLSAYKRSTTIDGHSYKAWHGWALLNFKIATQLGEQEEQRPDFDSESTSLQAKHIVTAVNGFVQAIGLGTKTWSASVQQDMLNFLTCLFRYGGNAYIAGVIRESVGSVTIEAWLGVLPQLLARIHIKTPTIQSILHSLLIRLGEKHPQALMYPLSVLLKSPVAERKTAAESLMNSLKAHSSALVEEALMVSSELIRVAILWLELWHEGLEDASRLYFGEGNVPGMLDLLLPLHEAIEAGAVTRRENDFLDSFGKDLAQAHRCIQEYIRLMDESSSFMSDQPLDSNTRQNEAELAMNDAWDIYYTVFRRINKQLPALTKLEITQCSPALSKARGLELGVPGSYRVDGSYVKIERFIPNVQVIPSKQRPRKITLRGSDGKDYVFLLKGHEDLRQDERVMQLFGLVNALLERDRQTKKHDLRIQRYAISPLSHNCGLVGWVPHTDTLHSVIQSYRQTKKIPLNLENREMLKIAPDYDLLTMMQKVQVFTEALRNSVGGGNDLYEILWLKSTNSEEWLQRRTKFTRSLAVMSMVGYILGLGDRHPSNLMLDKLSGRILHIDFGDCFEVAMNRDKYPERVPFRLTRMLIKAMEVSGIEGSYRSTCERTMTVLRESRDSLVAMLEAFVYDPLISWRLADLSAAENNCAGDGGNENDLSGGNLGEGNVRSRGMGHGVERDVPGRTSFLNEPITEAHNEDSEDEATADVGMPQGVHQIPTSLIQARRQYGTTDVSANRARSLQMYSNIQTWAANIGVNSRIASITGNEGSERAVAEGSIARSRIERSMRQRELISLLEGDQGAAREESLNEKALKVIQRVQDKLNGTDFPDSDEYGTPLDVPDQVQRLIVQATSVENLCQSFIGWCAFW